MCVKEAHKKHKSRMNCFEFLSLSIQSEPSFTKFKIGMHGKEI